MEEMYMKQKIYLKDNNKKEEKRWLYCILLDGEYIWVGSSKNLDARLREHKSRNRSGNIGYYAAERGIDLSKCKVEVRAFEYSENGVNFSEEDLKWREHTIIRRLKEQGAKLWNKRVNYRKVERDRNIDEIDFFITPNFKFYKLLKFDDSK